MAQVPFIVDPPVVRLDPEQTRALQIWFTQPPETLPKDRESQFWLHVLEIPAIEETNPEQEKQQENRLDISILTRIKVFYRPQALADYRPHNPDDRLTFTVETDEQGQPWLRIHNPAPIHQTLDKLVLHQGDEETVIPDAVRMLPPFGQTRIKSPSAINVADASLDVSTLDDHGKKIDYRQTIGFKH